MIRGTKLDLFKNRTTSTPVVPNYPHDWPGYCPQQLAVCSICSSRGQISVFKGKVPKWVHNSSRTLHTKSNQYMSICCSYSSASHYKMPFKSVVMRVEVCLKVLSHPSQGNAGRLICSDSSELMKPLGWEEKCLHQAQTVQLRWFKYQNEGGTF